MSNVAVSAQVPPDLIDLRFLPAWVKQDAPRYSDFEGEEAPVAEFRAPRERKRREERRRDKRRDLRKGHGREEVERSPRQREAPSLPSRPPERLVVPDLDIRFLPHPVAFDNVAAQIKNGTAAYSLHALARLFLQKPERYDVRVIAQEPFFRLGETSMISTDRETLEHSAFHELRDDYYQIDVTLAEPVKGNFTSVARERTSGVLLGPTNHHAYQTQLRRLYEQRFSRRMSFPDFQRRIEIVSDPTLVEQWKEQTRETTKFTTRREEPPQIFLSESDAMRHFREKYLPGLVAETTEAEIDGRTSRRLRDRSIARAIERAWSTEERSPSKMMQELSTRFRAGGLHIFRHRKGMLFVSTVRPKPIDESAVSDAVRRIIETLKASPRINRRDLAQRLIPTEAGNDEAKMKLASELHWLVSEGHIVEFNDGSLDLPRVKAAAETGPKQQAATGNSAQIPPAETAATESPSSSRAPASS